jgi:hypothetical protein
LFWLSGLALKKNTSITIDTWLVIQTEQERSIVGSLAAPVLD